MKFKWIRNSVELGALASHLWSTAGFNSETEQWQKPSNNIDSFASQVNRLAISSYLTNSYRKIITKARAAHFLLLFIDIFSGNPNCSLFVSFLRNKSMDRLCPKIYFNLRVKFLKWIVSIRVPLRILDLNLHIHARKRQRHYSLSW